MATLYNILLLLCAAALVAPAESTSYIDCTTGTFNVILSAPHGGSDKPTGIPDRQNGCYDSTTDTCNWSHSCTPKDASNCGAKLSKDLHTLELAQDVRDILYNLTGKYPYLVSSNLHRKKLDPNRPRDEGAQHDSAADTAWDAYHDCIDDAKAAITAADGTGLLVDIHGYGYTGSNPKAQLGYLITKTRLNTDTIVAGYTSIKALAARVPGSIEDLVQGADSLGAYMEDHGYAALPSPTNLSPGSATYFTGGYITRQDGSRYGGYIDAIQIESPTAFRTDSDYAEAVANAIYDYIDKYY